MKLLIHQQTITCVPLIPETFCTFMKTQSGPLALGSTMTTGRKDDAGVVVASIEAIQHLTLPGPSLFVVVSWNFTCPRQAESPRS